MKAQTAEEELSEKLKAIIHPSELVELLGECLSRFSAAREQGDKWSIRIYSSGSFASAFRPFNLTTSEISSRAHEFIDYALECAETDKAGFKKLCRRLAIRDSEARTLEQQQELVDSAKDSATSARRSADAAESSKVDASEAAKRAEDALHQQRIANAIAILAILVGALVAIFK